MIRIAARTLVIMKTQLVVGATMTCFHNSKKLSYLSIRIGILFIKPANLILSLFSFFDFILAVMLKKSWNVTTEWIDFVLLVHELTP